MEGEEADTFSYMMKSTEEVVPEVENKESPKKESPKLDTKETVVEDCCKYMKKKLTLFFDKDSVSKLCKDFKKQVSLVDKKAKSASKKDDSDVEDEEDSDDEPKKKKSTKKDTKKKKKKEESSDDDDEESSSSSSEDDEESSSKKKRWQETAEDFEKRKKAVSKFIKTNKKKEVPGGKNKGVFGPPHKLCQYVKSGGDTTHGSVDKSAKVFRNNLCAPHFQMPMMKKLLVRVLKDERDLSGLDQKLYDKFARDAAKIQSLDDFKKQEKKKAPAKKAPAKKDTKKKKKKDESSSSSEDEESENSDSSSEDETPKKKKSTKKDEKPKKKKVSKKDDSDVDDEEPESTSEEEQKPKKKKVSKKDDSDVDDEEDAPVAKKIALQSIDGKPNTYVSTKNNIVVQKDKGKYVVIGSLNSDRDVSSYDDTTKNHEFVIQNNWVYSGKVATAMKAKNKNREIPTLSGNGSKEEEQDEDSD